MPKATPLTPSRVIEYFKTANLETADLVLGLVATEVKGRKQKSQDAKAAQKKGKGHKGPHAAPVAGTESEDPGTGDVAHA